MAIKLITDSVADIPPALVKKHDILVFPLTVNFEDGSYVDGVDLTGEQFFEKLNEAKTLPTTSQVTVGVFVEKFQQLLEETDDQYFGLFMSAKMSNTYNAALQATVELDTNRIKVVDSRLVSFTFGQIVLALAEFLPKAKSLEQLEEVANKLIDATKSRYIVDTLDSLHKGGRLSATEKFFGSMLNIKPILTIVDGELRAADKMRGRKKAIKFVQSWIEKNDYDLNGKYVSLFHACAEESLGILKSGILERFPKAIITESEIGAVVGTHSGPGCVAFSFIDIDKENIG